MASPFSANLAILLPKTVSYENATKVQQDNFRDTIIANKASLQAMYDALPEEVQEEFCKCADHRMVAWIDRIKPY